MRKISWLLVLTVALSLLAIGPAWSSDTIKVGVVGPRTGGAAATGKAFEEGIQLATDYVNAKGGVLNKKLEIVFEDTAGAPDKAASGFERLATRDKVVMVLGESHSSAALAEIEVANRLGIPFMVVEAWADPITAKNYRYVFRAGPSNSGVVNDTIAKWVAAEQFKKVAIVAENTDWGLGIAELTEKAMDKAGVPYLTVTTERKSQDHYMELTKLKAFDPDAVLAFVYGTGLHYFVAQAGEVGLTPKAIILDGAGPPSLWPDFWPNVGEYGDLECFVSSMHEKVELTELATQFRKSYVEAFGKAPTDYKSRSMFDAILIAADAINRAGSVDAEKLVEALEKTDLTVTRGKVTFGTEKGGPEYHHWMPPMLVIQWQNKEQVVLFPAEGATGKLKR
ncbi:MAG: ABC transporter substrate-binding protein [Desulfobacteraceae bacterium]|jgi:branched-chain amino acid transport system substrate-binding protein|nr:ABC transporter substrate-binding protein [Desulfobacteraceae bacterium]MBC2750948.1 ABC transporter substrate-binding protein [Desulfobacteraceae bacterium]